MIYEAELNLLRLTFKKSRVQTLTIDPKAQLPRQLDMGLGQLLGDENYYSRTFEQCVPPIRQATIYLLKDTFDCQYIYFKLPDSEEIFLIGPCMTKHFQHADVLEMAERHHLSPSMVTNLENYYNGIPYLSENSHLMFLIEAFAERLWGGSERYTLERVRQGQFTDVNLPVVEKKVTNAKEELWNMQIMERRYAFENDLMQAVSRGQIHRAEIILKSLSEVSLEKRTNDSLRNIKNYCVITNTLLRKAAEQGGVHPLYLDKVSSAFAHSIEKMDSPDRAATLMVDMVQSYSRLVKKYSLQSYSSPVQKCIVCVDADLTQNLTLGHLARLQNISAAYLSALFKKETGQTLTDYVNLKRVEHAKKLLKNTDLQVQTIAQHCGILDIHYFSRVFKKYSNMTPKEYRNYAKK